MAQTFTINGVGGQSLQGVDGLDIPTQTALSNIVPPRTGIYRRLFYLAGAKFNNPGDQIMPLDPNALVVSNFQALELVISSPTGSLGLSVGGIYTAASGGGTKLFTFSNVASNFQGSLPMLSINPSTNASANLFAPTPLYFNLTSALGGSSLANISVFGVDF